MSLVIKVGVLFKKLWTLNLNEIEKTFSIYNFTNTPAQLPPKSSCILAITHQIFASKYLIIFGLFALAWHFLYLQIKKHNGFNLHEQGGQFTVKFCEIICSHNVWISIYINDILNSCSLFSYLKEILKWAISF